MTTLYQRDEQGGYSFVSKRKTGDVRIPNYVYDLWTPLLGIEAIGVYAVYCRLERQGQVKGLTQKKLAKACRIGPNKLDEYNRLLVECKFIEIERPQGHKRLMHYTISVTVLDPPTTIPPALIEKYQHPSGYEPLSIWLVESEILSGASGDTTQYHEEALPSTSKIASLSIETSIELQSSDATAPGAAVPKPSRKPSCRLLSKVVNDANGQNPYWNIISRHSFKAEWASFTDAEKRVHQGRIQQILKALDGLDQEQPITPEELAAAYGWFRQHYPDADFPAGAESMARMLTNYRATIRSKSNGHRNNGSSKPSGPRPNCPICEGKGWYRAENGRDYSCNCEEAIHEQPTH